MKLDRRAALLALATWLLLFGGLIVIELRSISAPPRFRVYGASETEAANADAGLGVAYEVLCSAEFLRNFRSLEPTFPTVYASRDIGEISLSQLSDAIARGCLGRGFSRSRIVVEDPTNPDDKGSWYAGAGKFGQLGIGAQINFGPRIFGQFESRDPVERSCAVNTMAHELSHTLSRYPIIFVPLLTDTRGSEVSTGRPMSRASVPIATYLIGSTAQCTYLARNGRIAPSRVQSCVEVFGVAAFNDMRCGSFGGLKAVEWDASLPEAAASL